MSAARESARGEAVERYGSRSGKLVLWAALVVPIAAWIFHLGVSYSLVRYVCASGAAWLLHATTLASLAPVGGAGVVAWRAWRRAGHGSETAAGDLAGRTRFMGLLGIALNLAGALLIVSEWIPTLFLDPCA